MEKKEEKDIRQKANDPMKATTTVTEGAGVGRRVHEGIEMWRHLYCCVIASNCAHHLSSIFGGKGSLILSITAHGLGT